MEVNEETDDNPYTLTLFERHHFFWLSYFQFKPDSDLHFRSINRIDDKLDWLSIYFIATLFFSMRLRGLLLSVIQNDGDFGKKNVTQPLVENMSVSKIQPKYSAKHFQRLHNLMLRFSSKSYYPMLSMRLLLTPNYMATIRSMLIHLMNN